MDNMAYWITVSKSPLTVNQLMDLKDQLNWPTASVYQTMSEETIHNLKDYVNWVNISQYQKLSEKFITEHKDYVCWLYISKYQKLSEQFVVENKHLVVWDMVFKYQNISNEFVLNYKKNGGGALWKNGFMESTCQKVNIRNSLLEKKNSIR